MNKLPNDFFLVGPLPPPTHGFSEITLRMLSLLKNRTKVHVFNVTPKKKSGLFGKISSGLYLFTLLLKFWGMGRCGKNGVLYLPLSGGHRQLIDICFAIIALICGMRIFIHHHSFAYLNRPPLYSRIVFNILRNSIHIVLCERMGNLLCDSYHIAKDKIRVISNAAYLDAPSQYKSLTKKNNMLVLGFLSNITEAKGCFEFIELVNAAVDNGLMVEGIMAGPVEEEIKNSFSQALTLTENVHHIGSVYQEAKHDFFEKIDILVFPTKYINEAEPVTIWEALESGTPVIALSRGCINCIVSKNVGWVIDNSSNFIEQSLECLEYLLQDTDLLTKMKVDARLEFKKSKQRYSTDLNALLYEMLNGSVNAESS